MCGAQGEPACEVAAGVGRAFALHGLGLQPGEEAVHEAQEVGGVAPAVQACQACGPGRVGFEGGAAAVERQGRVGGEAAFPFFLSLFSFLPFSSPFPPGILF